ncbi:hypothetical protein GDO81_018345 [Engystomops pustulosus]|uniref:Uncharacterized protein n=1 Tax=Engystomops pustulosus TaxID=76066 RepID=A0AAV7AEN4_ENGPU|nr:hypothetical protein GDO81_018345 [Engystomops pustulosus]
MLQKAFSFSNFGIGIRFALEWSPTHSLKIWLIKLVPSDIVKISDYSFGSVEMMDPIQSIAYVGHSIFKSNSCSSSLRLRKFRPSN